MAWDAILHAILAAWMLYLFVCLFVIWIYTQKETDKLVERVWFCNLLDTPSSFIQTWATFALFNRNLNFSKDLLQQVNEGVFANETSLFEDCTDKHAYKKRHLLIIIVCCIPISMQCVIPMQIWAFKRSNYYQVNVIIAKFRFFTRQLATNRNSMQITIKKILWRFELSLCQSVVSYMKINVTSVYKMRGRASQTKSAEKREEISRQTELFPTTNRQNTLILNGCKRWVACTNALSLLLFPNQLWLRLSQRLRFKQYFVWAFAKKNVYIHNDADNYDCSSMQDCFIVLSKRSST